MELEGSREVAFCSFCGTKHIIRDDIINNTVINNTTQNIIKHFHGARAADYKDTDELVVDGETLLNLGQIEKAYEKFKKAIDEDPKNVNAWLGYASASARSSSPIINQATIPAYGTAYKLAGGGDQKESIFRSLFESVENSSDCVSAYAMVDGVHKDAILKKWLSCTNDYGGLFNYVTDNHKDAVLTKWTEDVENSLDGYIGLYAILCSVYGEESVKRTIVPKWVEQMRTKLNKIRPEYPNPSKTQLTFSYLNKKEKEKAIALLIKDACRRSSFSDHFQRRRAVVSVLAVEDSVALSTLKKHRDGFMSDWEISSLITRVRKVC